MPPEWSRRIEHVVGAVSTFCSWVAGICLFFMLVTILIDVTGRYFFNRPLAGGLELVELGMVILGGLAMVYTASLNAHLRTDLIAARLGPSAQNVLERIGAFLGFLLWLVLSYRVLLEGLSVLRSGEVTLTLGIVRGPFMLVAAAAIFLLSLVTLWHAVGPRHERLNLEV